MPKRKKDEIFYDPADVQPVYVSAGGQVQAPKGRGKGFVTLPQAEAIPYEDPLSWRARAARKIEKSSIEKALLGSIIEHMGRSPSGEWDRYYGSLPSQRAPGAVVMRRGFG